MLHSVSTHSMLHKPSLCTSACGLLHPSEYGIKRLKHAVKGKNCPPALAGVKASGCGGGSTSHVQV